MKGIGRPGAVGLALVLVGWVAAANAVAEQKAACVKADFEAVVDDAAGAIRDLNMKNKPAFQDKLRALKDKRGWSHDQFLKEAKPFVSDEKIASYEGKTEDLLDRISRLGQEGAGAKTPDCALLVALEGHMKSLVDTQTEKWSYMLDKIERELWK